MNDPKPIDSSSPDLERRLLDVIIRAGLILVLVILCYRALSPFLELLIWALILAIAMYPLHQRLAARMGGKQGWAATLITVLGVVLIVTPTALLLSSVGASVHHLVEQVRQNTLQLPPPTAGVADWPVVGPKLHATWQMAYEDLPGLVKSLQPQIGDLAKSAVAMVASIGGAILGFVAAFIIAGIIMAFGEGSDRASHAIFARIVGYERGDKSTALAVATIRAVAQGVIGIAFIQAILIGMCLLAARVPLAGLWAVIVLVLGIAQIPALIVTLPVIAYLWMSGGYGTVEATIFSVLLFVAGMADNVLKPLMLGRGVEVPMPVILLGALGGMAAGGILGLFVGAVVLAMGYQIFMAWVAANPEAKPSVVDGDPKATD